MAEFRIILFAAMIASGVFVYTRQGLGLKQKATWFVLGVIVILFLLYVVWDTLQVLYDQFVV